MIFDPLETRLLLDGYGTKDILIGGFSSGSSTTESMTITQQSLTVDRAETRDDIITIDWHGTPRQVFNGRYVLVTDTFASNTAGATASIEAQLQLAVGQDLSDEIHIDRRLGTSNVYLVNASSSLSTESVVNAVSDLPGFRYLEPNFVFHVDDVPNETRFSEQWGLNNFGQSGGTSDADIDAPEAWNLTQGSSRVVVGVADSGIDYRHPDLVENMWVNPGEIAGDGVDNDSNGYTDDVYGYDFFNGDSDPMDDNSHGTHVAGTIGAAANNTVGVAGVAWNVQLMALKIGNAAGSISSAAAVEALNYAAMMKQRGVSISITNHSWGGYGYSQAVVDAIQGNLNANMLVVAAAGNDTINNDSNPHYPSSYGLANIIAVAATDRIDALGSFSNYGLTTVDLGAPGVAILSSTPGNWYSSFNGTSMATPHVTGVAALLYSLVPNASYATVRDAILNGGDAIASLSGKTVTGKRLNAFGAIQQLGLLAVRSSPADLSVVSTAPTSFSIDFSQAYDTASIQASDLTVNGISADSFTLTDADTITFTFNTSPASAQGVQQLTMAAGAISRQSDGDAMESFSSQFRYDVNSLTVTSITPTSGSAVTAPLTRVFVNFSEAYLASSIRVDDLTLSAGRVTGFNLTDADTVEYLLTGVPLDQTITISLAAGAVTDAFGNAGQAFSGSLLVDAGIAGWTAWFAALSPAGSAVYSSSNDGVIGAPGDSDSYTISLDLGQSLSAVLRVATGLQAEIQVTGPGTSVTVSGTVTGRDVVAQAIPITTAGTYTVTVVGLSGTQGAYTLQLFLNASAETEDHGGAINDSLATAEDLESRFTSLGNGAYRSAVAGNVAVTSEGFESGLGSAWSTYSSDSGGRIQAFQNVGTVFTIGAAEGRNELVMDRDPSGVNTLNEAVWTVDLSNVSHPILSFAHIDYNDEETAFSGSFTGHFNADGIAISGNGTNWFPIWSAPAQTANTWQRYTLDLQTAAASAGITLGPGFRIKFQQYDNSSISGGDGRGWDDLKITASSDDWFRFDLQAGQSVSLALEGLPVTWSGLLELRNSANQLVSTGTALAQNFDVGISSYVTSAAGTFYAHVTGSALPYVLEVLKNAVFDIERNNDTSSSQSMTGGTAAVGNITINTVGTNYQLDDGVAEQINGASGGGDILWLNTLTAQPDGQVIVSISTAWWSVAAGTASTVLLYEDPNDDGIPTDAVLLTSVDTTVVNPSTNIFTNIPITPTTVSGKFFVGALVRNQASGVFPAPRDTTTTTGQTWSVTSTANNLNINNLTANSIGSTVGNWLVRATSSPATSDDWYSISVNAGDALTISTSTPAGAAGQFANTLDPAISLIDPNGNALTNSNGAADGRNALISSYTASVAGTYRVRVFGESGSAGEYVLHVAGPTGANPAFSVASTTPTIGGILATPPDTITVQFNDDVLQSTLQASDLTVDGVAATAVTVIDGRTARFTLAYRPIGASHTVSIAAGALQDLQGTPLSAYTATFSTPLTALSPAGSRLYQYTTTSTFVVSSDIHDYGISLDAGQRISVVVGTLSGLRPRIDLIAPDNTTTTISGTTTGNDVVLNDVNVPTSGVYIVRIRNLVATTGSYSLTLLLNGEAELENFDGATNNTLGTAQSINGAFISLGANATFATARGVAESALAGAGTSVSSTDVPKAIVDGGTMQSTLNVPSHSIIGDLNVTINATHTWDADLIITLISPSGTQISLVNGRGGSGDNFTNTIFDDEAVTPISGGTAPFTGSFRPEQLLSAVSGQDVFGTWTLRVQDLVTPDSGNLISWSITYAPVTPSFDYYSFTATAGTPLSFAFSTSTGAQVVELLDSSGSSLATATTGPTNLTSQTSQVIASYTGLYHARVTNSTTTASSYSLTVLKEAAFDSEPNSASTTAQPLGSATAAMGQLAPSTVGTTYRLDDGSADGLSGTSGGGDILWLNSFTAQAEGQTIASISTAWWSVAAGTASAVFLYEDPNDDGNPNDAVLLASVATTVTNPSTNLFATIPITPTAVIGKFFVGTLIRNHASGVNPAPFDTTTSAGQSWVVLASANNLNVNNLAAQTIQARTGNALIRATSTPAPSDDWYSFSLNSGQTVELVTSTPGGGSYEFVNAVDPIVELYNTSGTLVATADNNHADRRNGWISYVAAATGTYKARVYYATGSSGEYALNKVVGTGNVPTANGFTPILVPRGTPLSSSLSLHAAFADVEDADSSLTYSIVGNTAPTLFSSLTIDAQTGTLQVNSPATAAGRSTVTIRATDSQGFYVDAVLEVVIYLQVGDRVWKDLDADGIQDANESGLPGAIVELFRSTDAIIGNGDDQFVSVTITDAQGSFTAPGAVPGNNYYIVVHSPVGYSFTTQNVGADDTLDSDVDSVGRSAIFVPAIDTNDLTLDAGLTGAPPAFGYAFRTGNANADRTRAIGTDSAGNFYIAGEVNGSTDLDPGPGTTTFTTSDYDVYLAKYTPQGALVWYRNFGGSTTQSNLGLALDVGPDGSVVVGGNFRTTADYDPGPGVATLTHSGGVANDIYVAKFDANGNFQWARSAGGTGEEDFYDVAIADDGSVVLGAQFEGTVDFDPSPGATANRTSISAFDALLWKLDASGNFVWVQQFGQTADSAVQGVDIDSNGNIYFGGYFQGTIDLDAGAATQTLTAAGGSANAFVAQVHADGSFGWRAGLLGNVGLGFNFTGLELGPSNSVNVTGYYQGTLDLDPGAGTVSVTSTSGSFDVYAVRLDSAGNLVWARTFGGMGFDDSRSIHVNSAGEVAIAGSFQGSADLDPGAGSYPVSAVGGRDIYALRLNNAGDFVTVQSAGGLDSNEALDIVINESGQMFVVGSFSGTVDFDPTSDVYNQVSSGGSEGFVWELNPRAPVTISGRVWNDTDGDGVQDIGEAGVAGAVVELVGSSDTLVGNSNDFSRAVLITDVNGHYSFASQPDGHYYLLLHSPAGLAITTLGAGGIATLDSDFNSSAVTAMQFVAPGTSVALDAGLIGSQPDYGYAFRYGSTNDDRSYGVAVDSEGNYYVTGEINGSIDFDPGPYTTTTSTSQIDTFIAKYTAQGALIWSRMFGTSGNDSGYRVAVTTDGGVAVAGFIGGGSGDFDPGPGVRTLAFNGAKDVFVAKFDANGNQLWAKSAGGTGDDEVTGLQPLPGGGVVAVGTFNSSAIDFDTTSANGNLTNTGGIDGFVWKLDAVGDFAGIKQFGQSASQNVEPSAAAVTAAGDVLVGGRFGGTQTFGESRTLSAVGGDNAFLLQMNSAGTVQWVNALTGPTDGSITGLTIGTDGSIYAAGRYSGTLQQVNTAAGSTTLNLAAQSYDAFLTKFTAAGNYNSIKQIGGSGDQFVQSLAINPSGDKLAISGSFTGSSNFESTVTSAGGADGYVTLLDTSGNFLRTFAAGSTGGDNAFGVAFASNTQPIVVGLFANTVDFDPTAGSFQLVSAGNPDGFVWSLTLAAHTPTVTGATSFDADQTTSGLVISRNAADGGEVSHFKITGITGGTLYQNDGTTPINNGDFITYTQGNVGLKFTPTNDSVGTGTFNIQASIGDSDAGIGGAVVTANITVIEINDAPSGTNDSLNSIVEDSGNRTISIASLLANDSAGPANESGQTLTITAVGSAVGGTVSIVGTEVIFSPTANYYGPASFVYTLRDNGTTGGANDFLTSTAMVSFAITEVNDAPIAGSETLPNIAEDSGNRTIPLAALLSNDSAGPANESGQSLSITNVGLAVGGTVSIVGENVIFSPSFNFSGAASFVYSLQDNGTTNGVDDFKTTTATVSFTITDIVDPTFSFALATQSTSGETGTYQVIALASSPLEVNLTVPLLLGGTALNPTDYSLSGVSLFFPIGAISAAITLTVSADIVDEANETVSFGLNVPTGFGTVGSPATHTLTVVDDDSATANFAIANHNVNESGGSVSVLVTLSNPSIEPITIPFTVGGSAGGADFSVVTVSPLSIPAGQTSGVIVVSIVNDARDEANESITLNLETPTNAALGNLATHTITILDNDPSPLVQFTSGGQSVVESASTARAVVRLAAVSERDVTVPVTVTGSASAADATVITTLPITISAGQTSAAIEVTITDDAMAELTETVVFTIGTPTNGTLGAVSSHTLSIADNDALVQAQFETGALSVSEAIGSVPVFVTLSSIATTDVSVSLTLSGAASASDYLLSTTTLNIPAGQTRAIFTVAITDDLVDELAETLVLNLAAPSGALLGINSVITITIDDNDPVLSFARNSDTSTTENGTIIIVARTLSPVIADLTVPFASYGSATLGFDYTLSASTFQFLAGASTAAVTLTIVDDAVVESSEAVTLSLQPPPNTSLGSPGLYTLFISDNDTPPAVGLDLNGLASGQDFLSTVGEFVEDAGAFAIVPNATVVPPGVQTLSSITVYLESAPNGAAESLTAANSGGATATAYNPSTRSLTISGGTTNDQQAVLRSVAYQNSSQNPTAGGRFITVTANFSASSESRRRKLIVTPVDDAPVITTTAGNVTYVTGNAPILVDSGIALTDVENNRLVRAVVTVTDAESGDLLSLSSPVAGFTSTFAGNVLTITANAGSGNLAAFRSALSRVQFSTTTLGDGNRSVSFVVTDISGLAGVAGATSVPAMRTLNVQSPLLVAASPLNPAAANESLTAVQLAPLVHEAIARWESAGASAAQLDVLRAATIEIRDLADPSTLALAGGSTIVFDTNAAGRGWFLDSTPTTNEEFTLPVSSSSPRAAGPAVDRVDLLTTVMHEFGHLLGLDDHIGSSDLLAESLPLGTRRALTATEISQYFTQLGS